MNKPTVYVETSIISYLAARPSRDLVTAARQDITRDWWDLAARNFSLHVSSLVLDEASQGDTIAAKRRLGFMRGLTALESTNEAARLSQLLLGAELFPEGADNDAAHVALAAAHGMDYLVTWNFRHLANVHARVRIERRISEMGFVCPLICTPEELGEPE